MKRKVIIALSILAVMLMIMFAEYRFIMLNQHPYLSDTDTDTLYIEMFGQVDEYYLMQPCLT